MTPRTVFLSEKSLVRLSLPRVLCASLLATVGLLALLLDAPAAHSEGDAKSKADAALAAAVKQGLALYRKSWKKGAKGCFACHTRGPNKLTGRRLKSYPKYDKALKKVVTVQEKINAMIKKKSGGKQLDLGHADLTALEAYISTLK